MHLFICFINIIYNISSVFDMFLKIEYYIPNKLWYGHQLKKITTNIKGLGTS